MSWGRLFHIYMHLILSVYNSVNVLGRGERGRVGLAIWYVFGFHRNWEGWERWESNRCNHFPTPVLYILLFIQKCSVTCHLGSCTLTSGTLPSLLNENMFLKCPFFCFLLSTSFQWRDQKLQMGLTQKPPSHQRLTSPPAPPSRIAPSHPVPNRPRTSRPKIGASHPKTALSHPRRVAASPARPRPRGGAAARRRTWCPKPPPLLMELGSESSEWFGCLCDCTLSGGVVIRIKWVDLMVSRVWCFWDCTISGGAGPESSEWFWCLCDCTLSGGAEVSIRWVVWMPLW